MRHKREYDRLAKKVETLAELKHLQDLLTEIEDMVDTMTPDSIVRMAPIMSAKTAEARRLMEKYDILYSSSPEKAELFISVSDNFKAIYDIEKELIHETHRLVRLEQRKQVREARENVVMSGRVCSIEGCNKPARIDDYCKRHARDQGIIVHGKI